MSSSFHDRYSSFHDRDQFYDSFGFHDSGIVSFLRDPTRTISWRILHSASPLGDESRRSLVRTDSANIDSLSHMFVAPDGNGAVDMDLFDTERSDSSGI